MAEEKRAIDARHYDKHRGRILARAAARRVAHLEEARARDRQYAREHREKRRAYQAAYRAARREEERARDRAHAAARRAADPLYERRQHAKHRVKRNAYSRAYDAANRDRARAYAIAHAAEKAQRSVVRRARLLSAPGSHTLAEWREKVALFGGCCVYCGRSDRPLTRDHKVPLARGGSDGIANIVPACGSCNSRKGTRTAAEFLVPMAVR